MEEACSVAIPIAAEVVIAIRGDLPFRDDQSESRLKVDSRLVAAEGLEVGFEFGFDLREVISFDGAALSTEAEAVVLHLEERDGVAMPGERFVQDEDGGFHPRIRIETAGWEGDDGDEGIFDQHLPEVSVGGLALKDNSFRNDDAGSAKRGEGL